MEKKIVQDIISTNKRTIRDIPYRRLDLKKEKSRGSVREVTRIIPKEAPQRKVVEEYYTPEEPPVKKRRGISSLILPFVVIFIGLGVIAIALSLLYSKASVTITPKVVNFNIEGDFTAKKDANPNSQTIVSGPVYETLSKSTSIEQTVVATDGPLVQTKAKGTVYLYNEQKLAQKIVAGTRLANGKGMVYRTTATVVIPAMSKSPGSVSVEVVADEAGSEYNMSLDSTDLNLKVVAYKGTPKYTTVYGKLKTAISGGFSGNKKIIATELHKSTVQSLKDSAKAKLLEEIKSSVPEGYIFFENANNVEYEVSDPISRDANTAVISVKASMYAVIFKETTLIKSIASKELDKFPSATYRVEKMKDLNFSISNTKDFSAKSGNSLIFRLTGPVSIVGTFSENALKEELKGKTLKQSNEIFKRYPAISDAYALITPFWMRTFPNTIEDIKIEIKY